MILQSQTKPCLQYARKLLLCNRAFSKSRVALNRPVSNSPPVRKPVRPDRINYNQNVFSNEAPSKEILNYPLLTSNELERGASPPQKVKMLVRDYIEDSLYNPHYGYFPKQATIVTSHQKSLDFSAFRDSVHFEDEVTRRYTSYGLDGKQGPGRQLWHTPTELFKPYYGQAIARCLVSEYLLKYFPYEDFVVYEIGAGNGTLAEDILNFLQRDYPDVYERTRYNIVEISGNLAEIQRRRLAHHPCVTVNHTSAFHWNKREPSPCYFIAMEVIDNFAHDLVRYDLQTLEPYQGLVSADEVGDLSIHYTKVTDPLIASYLDLRKRLGHPLPIPRLLQNSPSLRKFYTNLPFAPNLSAPEFIPTRLLSLLRTVRKHFPRHRLLLSDFSSLPDTIQGVNAPVVQTRFQNTTVPCSTLLVQQGFFDIFFPTNFEHLRDMYEHVLAQPLSSRAGANVFVDEEPEVDTTLRPSPMTTSSSSLALGADFFSSSKPDNRRSPLDGVASASGLPVGERKSSVFSHAEFMETYADLTVTTLRNGENPMLDYYKNVKFLF